MIYPDRLVPELLRLAGELAVDPEGSRELLTSLVILRFLEDNNLIWTVLIAGESDVGRQARGYRELFLRAGTNLGYLRYVLETSSRIPPLSKIVDWDRLRSLPLSEAEVCRLFDFFSEIDHEEGGLLRRFISVRGSFDPLAEICAALRGKIVGPSMSPVERLAVLSSIVRPRGWPGQLKFLGRCCDFGAAAEEIFLAVVDERTNCSRDWMLIAASALETLFLVAADEFESEFVRLRLSVAASKLSGLPLSPSTNWDHFLNIAVRPPAPGKIGNSGRI